LVFDWTILNAVHFGLANPVLDVMMPFFDIIGYGIVGAVWFVVLLFFKDYRTKAFYIAVAMAIAFLIVYVILEPLIMRPRPFTYVDVNLLVPPPESGSMPSSHAADAAAIATAVTLINKKWAWIIIPYAVFQCFTRLYLYVHFPTDVIVGAAIGVSCGFVAKRIVDAVSDSIVHRKLQK